MNAPLSAKELALLRVSVERGRHFGVEECVKRTASELGLGHTVRPEDRPPKPRNWLRTCFRPRDGWALSALDLGGPVARPEVLLWRTTENEPPTPGLGQSTNPRLETLPSVAFMARPALPGRPQITYDN